MRRASWRDAGPRRAAVGALVVVVVGAAAGCGMASPSGSAHEPAASTVEPVAVPGLRGCAGLERGATSGDDSEERLPDVALPCLTESRRVDTSRLGGKPLLVNLWASWCGPCRKEMPRLAEAALTTPEVQFLGINTMDDPEMAADFLGSTGVTYPQLVDVDGVVLDFTRVPGLPVTVALDSDGRIIEKVIGEVSDDELDTLLESLAGE